MKYMNNMNMLSPWQEVEDEKKLESLCDRSGIDMGNVMEIVSEIESGVLKKGDVYISELTEKFDGVRLDDFLVTPQEFEHAAKSMDDKFVRAIEKAYANIFSFHSRQKRENLSREETSKGVVCWQEFRPLETVGLYVPGGTAPLFSTVLMLSIPALIAGCKTKVLCTPPRKDGSIAPEILYVAKKCGITQVYKVGGAQAVFAMAHGTSQIPKVDKIFGPGNSFVTAAKMKVSAFTAIDMPAGPSEVLVMADENVNPVFAAADILSQAEHGTDSQSVLVCSSAETAERVLQEVQTQVQKLERKDVAMASLENSFVVVCENIDEMVKVSNVYAPEHLIVHMENWEDVIADITNAGSVFCGEYSCESAGDYASGTNHTLPTSGFARNYSGVMLESFGKWITFQNLSREGICDLGESIITMAQREGLDAHANAVQVRIK